MLLINRKAGQGFYIGRDIYVRIIGKHGDSIEIGINAPRHKSILRDELKKRLEQGIKQLGSNDKSKETQSCYSYA